MPANTIHWHPPSAPLPRARCGAHIATAVVSRDPDKVTCLQCRSHYLRGCFGLEPMLGRSLTITLTNGDTTRGELVATVSRGLEICRPGDETPVLLTWRRIRKAQFVARPAREHDDGEDAAFGA